MGVSESRISALVASSIREGLKSADWRARMEALDALCLEVRGGLCRDVEDAETLFGLLGAHPGFKEPNIPTMAKLVQSVTAIAGAVCDIPLRVVAEVVPKLTERLSDPKTAADAEEALLALAEGSGVRGVSHLVAEHCWGSKRCGVQAQGNLWLVVSLESFGGGAHDVARLAAHTHRMLAHTNPDVRAASLALCSALARHVGPSFRDMMSAAGGTLLKPVVQKQVDAALAHVATLPPFPAPHPQFLGFRGTEALLFC